MDDFIKGWIYTAKDRQGNNYCYRHLGVISGKREFVNLITWKHSTFDGDDFCMVGDGKFKHEIMPRNICGEEI